MTEDYKERVLIELTQLAIDERDNTYFDIAREVEEVYRKAQAFDETKEFIIEKLKEEEEKPHTLLGDYEYGLYQAYNFVDDIIQEHMERADDEVNGNTKPKNDSVSKYIDRLDDDNIMG